MKLFDTCARPTLFILGLTVVAAISPAQALMPPALPAEALMSGGSGARILLVGPVGAAQRVPGVSGELVLDPAKMTSSVGSAATLDQLRARLGDVPGVEGLYSQTFVPGSPPSLSEPRPLVLRLLDEAGSRAIADRFLARTGADLQGWSNARLGRSVPFYRPDVDGVAYYEFEVVPTGFVIVATGPHDLPVTSFSILSTPQSRRLLAEVGPAADAVRIYRLSDFAYVAEDAAARRVAQLGNLPFDAPRPGQVTRTPDHADVAWPEYRAGYAATFATGLAQKRSSAAVRWQHERASTVAPSDTWVRHLTFAGSMFDQRLYNQFYRGSCVSGCVPTAWAMLLGWVDVRAHGNDSRWAPHTDLFRAGGTTNGSPAAVAPQQTNGNMYSVPVDVQTLVNFLGYCQGTSCGGSTMPGLAAQTYLTLATHPVFGGNGLVSAHGDWDTWHIHYNTYRDYAIGSIQSGMPCVVGRDSHSMLA